MRKLDMNIVLNASFIDFNNEDIETIRKKWMIALRSYSKQKLSYKTIQLLSRILIEETNYFKNAKYAFVDIDSIPFLDGEKDTIYDFSVLFSSQDDKSKSPPIMIDQYENRQYIEERDQTNQKIEKIKSELLSLLKEEDQDRGNVLISELSELLSLSGIPYA
jgi:hypothetical protein